MRFPSYANTSIRTIILLGYSFINLDKLPPLICYGFEGVLMLVIMWKVSTPYPYMYFTYCHLDWAKIGDPISYVKPYATHDVGAIKHNSSLHSFISYYYHEKSIRK